MIKRALCFGTLLLAGCSGGSRECFTDADCTAGVCLPNGTCGPAQAQTTGTSSATGSTGTGTSSGTTGGGRTSPSSTSTGSGSTAGSSSSASTSTAGASSSGASTSSSGTTSASGVTSGSTTGSTTGSAGPCAFTGVITASQLPLGPGLSGVYQVSEDAGFDSTGTPLPDGGFLWDMSGTFGNDHPFTVATQPLSAEWFGPDYPDASYAAVLSDTSTNLGVFQTEAEAIDLVGLATPTQTYPVTEVFYSPPVPVFSFPLQVGSQWSVNSTVTGTVTQFLDQTYFEDYVSQVDKTGLLVIPGGSMFPVLRVRADLTRTYDLIVTTTRTYSFVTPCVPGTLASLVSQTDEPSVEFSDPALLERIVQP